MISHKHLRPTYDSPGGPSSQRFAVDPLTVVDALVLHSNRDHLHN